LPASWPFFKVKVISGVTKVKVNRQTLQVKVSGVLVPQLKVRVKAPSLEVKVTGKSPTLVKVAVRKVKGKEPASPTPLSNHRLTVKVKAKGFNSAMRWESVRVTGRATVGPPASSLSPELPLATTTTTTTITRPQL
jgi:hypothetical protein